MHENGCAHGLAWMILLHDGLATGLADPKLDRRRGVPAAFQQFRGNGGFFRSRRVGLRSRRWGWFLFVTCKAAS